MSLIEAGKSMCRRQACIHAASFRILHMLLPDVGFLNKYDNQMDGVNQALFLFRPENHGWHVLLPYKVIKGGKIPFHHEPELCELLAELRGKFVEHFVRLLRRS